KGLRKYNLQTFYVGERVDIKLIREHAGKKLLNYNHPLVVELEKNKYAVLTKFGTATFWNCTDTDKKNFLGEIDKFIQGNSNRHSHGDTLNVYVGGKEEHFTFEDAYIKSLDLERIKIISYVSAQSVALDHYEDEIEARLKDLGKVVEDLKTKGRPSLTQTEILKQVGDVLSVKQNAVSRLSLFDKPDETWEKEEIEQLYLKLRTEYEIMDRFDVLNEKIDFLAENNDTLLNYLASKRSNFLEIIVIVLIAVEIVLFVVELMRI
ncbi:MAG: RMD1 family protein, partial [Candidatus Liptonbacteria bacterium]|nr:RMD1 family protein [Candidatus Liptonbacteria bacterium]